MQVLNVLYQVCVFFLPIGKRRWPTWRLIGWYIFDFLSGAAEQNSTSSTKFVFLGRSENKDGRLASDWPILFRLLWNRLTEFDETLQEACTKVLYQVCVFPTKMAVLISVLLRHFRLLLCLEFKRKLKGIKYQHLLSSTKFVFFGPIRKLRWLPWPLIGGEFFNFSTATTERNSTKLDRKQEVVLYVVYQVRVFRADRLYKIAALASEQPIHFRLLFCTEFIQNLTGSKISTSSINY